MTTLMADKPESERALAPEFIVKHIPSQVGLYDKAVSLASGAAAKLARLSDRYAEYRMTAGYKNLVTF